MGTARRQGVKNISLVTLHYIFRQNVIADDLMPWFNIVQTITQVVKTFQLEYVYAYTRIRLNKLIDSMWKK